MCDEWKTNFLSFKKWAISHGYSDTLSIDRIDVNGDYEPQNCRWATYQVQLNNTRKARLVAYNNVTMSISNWARHIGMAPRTLNKRLSSYGWSVERALTTPVLSIHNT